jgi:hypothetical protein
MVTVLIAAVISIVSYKNRLHAADKVQNSLTLQIAQAGLGVSIRSLGVFVWALGAALALSHPALARLPAWPGSRFVRPGADCLGLPLLGVFQVRNSLVQEIRCGWSGSN